MSIRKKILLSFSFTVIVLLGITLFFIYTLFAEYREEEFQQRQKEKITTTLRLITETQQLEKSLVEALDRLTINDLYNEKLLIFDQDKKLIYSSIDDTPIRYSGEILQKLSPENPWLEQKDGIYDVVGIYIENASNSFYGISKANDYYGYSKLNYLKNVLVAAFIVISIVVLLVSAYLAEKISFPLIDMAKRIQGYDFINNYEPLSVSSSHAEIGILADQFNKLMKRMEEVFSFQKHAIHHISHELKTPISVLVSNFERMEKEKDPAVLQQYLELQKQDTKELAAIIDTLLEIAKVEAGHLLRDNIVRIDEMLFDIVEEVGVLYPEFLFHVGFSHESMDDQQYQVYGNHRLLKMAFRNLLQNAVHYSDDNRAEIKLSPKGNTVEISISNRGKVIETAEQQFMFRHFFRGQNNLNKRGFGLGLVFVHRILELHKGNIVYTTNGSDTNKFTVMLPLSRN